MEDKNHKIEAIEEIFVDTNTRKFMNLSGSRYISPCAEDFKFLARKDSSLQLQYIMHAPCSK